MAAAGLSWRGIFKGPGMAFNRRLALAGGALAAGLGYAALHRSGGQAVAIPRGTLRRGNGAEPGSLDPALISGDQENNITGDLLVGLMQNDVNAEPVPGMAASWTM